jgi:hypothetical protein
LAEALRRMDGRESESEGSGLITYGTLRQLQFCHLLAPRTPAERIVVVEVSGS